jgi:hypothetical protein
MDNMADRDNKGRFNLGKLYSNSTTGYPGVSWNKRKNKYQVRIKMNGKRLSLGYYDNIEEAGTAYQSKLQEAAK